MDLNIFVILIISLLHNCECDYLCLCNYNVETSVYKSADNTAAPIGALYDYDCNTLISDVNPLWATIVYHEKVAFVEKNAQTVVQMCHGVIPDGDTSALTLNQRLTTRDHTRSTSHKPATTIPNTSDSTETTIILAKNTPDTATSTNQTKSIPTTKTTTPAYLLEGHIDSCPDYIRNTDVNRYHGFLGQYGEYCYELVDAPTQWLSAERHCKIVSTGSLVHVLNQNEQDYIVRFLSNHSYVQTVWLGLTDGAHVGGPQAVEGSWSWISGATYQYNNFGVDFTSHSQHGHDLNDCVVMKPGGEWTDVPCGVSATLGIGFGESHPYICQYNITSSLPMIVDAFPHAIVG